MLATIANNIPSLLLYLIVFICSALSVLWGLSLCSKKKKIAGLSLMALGILLPSVMAGIRYGVGNDFFPYLSMYNNAVMEKKLYFRPIEPASALLITASGFIRSPFLMFFGFSFITNACFFFAAKNIFRDDRKMISVTYFLTLLLHFSTSLNVMRSIAAIAILALSFSLIVNKRNAGRIILSILLIFAAALFHLSALIALAFVPAFCVVFCAKKTITIILTWSAYVLFAALIPVLLSIARAFVSFGNYERYLGKIGYSFSIPLANMLMIVPLVIAGIYYYHKRERSNIGKMANLFFCAIFYVPISIAVGWIAYAEGLSRISFILDFLVIAVMAHLLIVSKAKILKGAIIIVAGLMLVRNMSWSGVLPYKTVFWEDTSAIVRYYEKPEPQSATKVIFILEEKE